MIAYKSGYQVLEDFKHVIVNYDKIRYILQMQDPALDQKIKNEAFNVIPRLKELQASKDWKENGVKPCPMFKMEIGERVASKGVDVVKFNIEKVIKFLEQEESLGKINPMLLEIKTLLNNEGVYKIIYMEYKGIWPVSNRDFVNVSVKKRESEGKMYIGTKSMDYPHPAKEGTVRGEVFIGGYVLEKIDEETTRVTYISDADLKGAIPGMIKNTLSSKQGEIASKIAPIMQKEGY